MIKLIEFHLDGRVNVSDDGYQMRPFTGITVNHAAAEAIERDGSRQSIIGLVAKNETLTASLREMATGLRDEYFTRFKASTPKGEQA